MKMSMLSYRKLNKYFNECVDREEAEKYNLETKQLDNKDFIKFYFRLEVGHNIKRVGQQRAFIDWCQGLPSVFNIDFIESDIEKILLNFEYTEKKIRAVEKKHFLLEELASILYMYLFNLIVIDPNTITEITVENKILNK